MFFIDEFLKGGHLSSMFAISTRAELAIIHHFASVKAFEEGVLAPHYARLLLSLLGASQQRVDTLVFSISFKITPYNMEFIAVSSASPWLFLDLN